jgi:hypothetical protein
MIPQSQPKKKKNSSRVNLTISAVVHGLLVLALVYFAAREGYLGKKIQKFSVQMVKEKKPEPPKPKPPEKPKAEPPKETPKPVAPPKAAEPPRAAPAAAAPPTVAPPAVDVPAFEFSGGKTVVTESDPVQLYKGYMEFLLRSKWDRPEDMADDKFVADVQVRVEKSGAIKALKWLKGSGNARWDQSVKAVFQEVHAIDRPPPTNFPPVVVVRFDVAEEPENILP